MMPNYHGTDLDLEMVPRCCSVGLDITVPSSHFNAENEVCKENTIDTTKLTETTIDVPVNNC